MSKLLNSRAANSDLDGCLTSASAWEHGSDAFDEGFGVELGAEDLVGAVGEDGYAPVADEGYELARIGGLDGGAEEFCFVDAFLPFYVDEDEVVGVAIKECERLGGVEGRVDIVARETEDLVAEGA